jgi:hypothetical protein
MPTRCNRRFYCRSYCLLNMFRCWLHHLQGDHSVIFSRTVCSFQPCKSS